MMSGTFLTNLCTECVDDLANSGRGIWKVINPLVYSSEVLGKIITIEPGFLTDYASVPRLPIIYWLLGDTSHMAAVVHDWLYHHHELCDEDTADAVLLEAMQAEGISAGRRWMIYQGVRLGGKSSWEADAGGNGHSIVNGQIV